MVQGFFWSAMVTFVTLLVIVQAIYAQVSRVNFPLMNTGEGVGTTKLCQVTDSELSDHNAGCHLKTPSSVCRKCSYQIDIMAPVPKISEPPTSATISATIKL
tara:strand:+ start:778 stop:1083 length:306 start_codon:yes stop_codon:yes gene_type:complete